MCLWHLKAVAISSHLVSISHLATHNFKQIHVLISKWHLSVLQQVVSSHASCIHFDIS